MYKLVGSHFILRKLPIWATAAIFAAVLMTVFAGRDIFEGLPYNVAYSSLVGDVGLMVIVLIGATILQARVLCVPPWLRSPVVHIVILWWSIMLGIIVCTLTLSSRSGQAMDIYHDVVIVPLFLYLAVTLLPIIFRGGNGTTGEKVTTICLVLLWVGLVSFDVTHDRMNQRQWLQNHGVTLTLKN